MSNKKNKKNKVKIIIISCIVFIILVISVYIGIDIYKECKGKETTDNPVTIHIDDIDTTKDIALKLKQAGIIKYQIAFRVYVSHCNPSREYQRGDVVIDSGSSYSKLLVDLLESAYTPRKTVTIRIPEGSEVKDIVDIFVANGIGDIDSFNEILENYDFGYEFLPLIGTTNRMEGYLSPNTYEFYADATPSQVLQKLVKQFNSVINSDQTKDLINNSKYSFRELIILASIVEKESGTPDDMPIIASVFYNRLNKGMKLQSDATLNYTIDKNLRSVALTSAQQKIDSPYNTYMYNGLPPTPISNPSANAIMAVLKPADSDYLYFCSKGDGTAAFATTYDEHMENVKKYKGNW